ncbi:MAG TPA: aminotransferase class IV, partial [Chitinophagales bacterium]|nr:aminotransferase class IV [Chitinophagales bacterium]
VEGVLRKKLIHLFNQHQLSFREVSVTPEVLTTADEVFVTNAGWGIKPITKFGDKIFGTAKTKEVFRMLYDSLSK